MAQGDGGLDPVEVLNWSDLVVRADLDLPGVSLVVTFTPRRDFAAKGRERGTGFGEDLFRREGVPYICFISKANHWWNTPELDLAIENLRPRLARFSRIVTYGVSMGAYGALVAARDLGATHVIACSPQADLSGRLPLHPTWRRDLRGVALIRNLAERPPAPGTSVTLVLDSLVPMDNAHRRAIEAMCPASTLPTPFSGHSSALFLADLGLLKPLVLDAVAGRLNLPELRRSLRAARLQHPLYLTGIAARLAARGRPGLARNWRGRAVERLIEGARWDLGKAHAMILNHLRQLVELGRHRQWKTLVARLLDQPAHSYSAHLSQAEVYLTAGAAKPAVQAAKAAAILRPKQAQPHLFMAAAQLRAGDVHATEKHLHAAMARSGGPQGDWARLAVALRDAGHPDAADRAVAHALHLYPDDIAIQSLAKKVPR